MIFILNRHCPLYGLQSKKQLAEILHITDKNLLKGKTQDEINKSKAHSPINSPWRKGLPALVSHRSMNYAVNHGC